MPVTPNALLEAAKVLGRGEAEVDRRNAARACSHYNLLNLFEKISTHHGLRAFSRCFTWQNGRPAPLDAFLRAISVNTP